MIDGEISQVLHRHEVGSYATHWDGAAAIMDIELGPYSLKINTNYKTMMITGRGVTDPECRPFTEWMEYLASDLQRQGVDSGWWYRHRAALFEIFGLLSSDHRQAPAFEPRPTVQELKNEAYTILEWLFSQAQGIEAHKKSAIRKRFSKIIDKTQKVKTPGPV